MEKVGETGLIERAIKIIGYWGTPEMNGSDDAVAVAAPPDIASVPIINTDILVDTTDVPPQMTLYQAGKKAAVMGASDVVVKGARPQWAIVGLGIPRNLPLEGERGFDGLIEGIRDGCHAFGMKYVGGDLAETREVIVSITCVGYCRRDQIIHRSGAHPGDGIYTLGSYGLTGLGLALFLDNTMIKPSKFDMASLSQAVLRPSIDLEVGPGMATAGWASASADSSDGLLKTLLEIAKTSKVGVWIQWDHIPVAKEVFGYLDAIQSKGNERWEKAERWVMQGGEEFHHVFTVPAQYVTLVEQKWGNRLTKIGEIVVADKGCYITDHNGNTKNFSEIGSGYNHFA